MWHVTNRDTGDRWTTDSLEFYDKKLWDIVPMDRALDVDTDTFDPLERKIKTDPERKAKKDKDRARRAAHPDLDPYDLLERIEQLARRVEQLERKK